MANKLKHHGTNTTLVSTSEMYSRIISNIGDINLLIDLKGKILKINLPNKNINKNLNSWLNKNIFDFLTIESKEKLDLQITSLTEINILSTKGFELNHVSTDTGEFPVRYKGFKTEDKLFPLFKILPSIAITEKSSFLLEFLGNFFTL